jgi:tetratricopeptide (TPR) repeat protein
MFKPSPILFPLFLSAIVSLASSCAHPPQPTDTEGGSDPHPLQQSATEDVRTRGSLDQAKACLSSGNYTKALEIYNAAVDRHPANEDLLDTYTEALEGIKEEADKAYAAKDYAKAGKLYTTLLKSGFGERLPQGELSFDSDDLTMRTGACSKMLFERGIIKYRAGNLEQAIAIWKKILVFNPSDREAKTAIDRAAAQLKNLKQMK